MAHVEEQAASYSQAGGMMPFIFCTRKCPAETRKCSVRRDFGKPSRARTRALPMSHRLAITKQPD